MVFGLGRHAGRGFARLLLLWLALVSMQNFFGYLFIAPFARAGDTGLVLSLLHAPLVVYLVCFALGAAGTLLNARLLAGQVIRYARGRDELRHTVLFAWLTGTGAVVLLTLLDLTRWHAPEADYPVIVAGAVSTAIFAPLFTVFYRRLRAPYEHLDLRRPLLPLAVLVVLSVFVLAVVAPGVRL